MTPSEGLRPWLAEAARPALAGRAAGRPPASRRGPAAQLGRRHREDLEHRVVEGPDAREAGREGDVAHRQGRRLDQQPGGLGPLRPGQCQRAGPELGEQLPLDLPDAVAELGGQSGDPRAVDDPVGDEPHRPGDQVGALVPLRRPRARVGPASLAGAEAGLLRGGGTGEEAHVLRLGRTAGQLGRQ